MAIAAHSQTASVEIDFAKPIGAMQHNGIGLLHSISADQPPENFIAPLRPVLWRGASNLLNAKLYKRLKGYGTQIQYLLTSGFPGPTGWPYENWDQWRKFLEAKALKAKSENWDLIWEPWNEPDDSYFWKGTYAQYLTAFQIAGEEMRKVDPNAVMSGPSLAARVWSDAKPRIIEFMEFCLQQGIRVEYLTWHEFDDKLINEIPSHTTEIMNLARGKYAALGIKGILISEVSRKPHLYSPGHTVVLLKNLEDAEIAATGRSCRSNIDCWEPTLDGMLCNRVACGAPKDGEYAPRASWWANYWYSQLRGIKYTATSSFAGMAAIGVREGNDVSVLVGSSSCGQLNTRHTTSTRRSHPLSADFYEIGCAGCKRWQV